MKEKSKIIQYIATTVVVLFPEPDVGAAAPGEAKEEEVEDADTFPPGPVLPTAAVGGGGGEEVAGVVVAVVAVVVVILVVVVMVVVVVVVAGVVVVGSYSPPQETTLTLIIYIALHVMVFHSISYFQTSLFSSLTLAPDVSGAIVGLGVLSTETPF